ncbi:hypothetical protein RFI_27657, partial [Reticulomyxa filosa]
MHVQAFDSRSLFFLHAENHLQYVKKKRTLESVGNKERASNSVYDSDEKLMESYKTLIVNEMKQHYETGWNIAQTSLAANERTRLWSRDYACNFANYAYLIGMNAHEIWWKGGKKIRKEDTFIKKKELLMFSNARPKQKIVSFLNALKAGFQSFQLFSYTHQAKKKLLIKNFDYFCFILIDCNFYVSFCINLLKIFNYSTPACWYMLFHKKLTQLIVKKIVSNVDTYHPFIDFFHCFYTYIKIFSIWISNGLEAV